MIYHYPHPEYFNGLEHPDFTRYSGNLILWGAGRIGGVAAHCLKQRGIKILAFCDTAIDKQGGEFCGYPVISPQEMKNSYPDAAVIVTSTFQDKIYQKLRQFGFGVVFNCVSLFLEFDYEGYDFWLTPEYANRMVYQYMEHTALRVMGIKKLERILLVITTRCSLRCKNCDSLIPYMKNHQHYNADDIAMDIEHVLEVIGSIRRISLFGGEPLLHPELPKILNRFLKDDRIGFVDVITNGTIAPSDDFLAVACSFPEKFLMRISDYGELSRNIEKIKMLLSKNALKHEITNYSYWDRLQQMGHTGETEEELIVKYRDCTTRTMYVNNGKLLICSPVTWLSQLGVLPNAELNYADLRAHENVRKTHIADYIRNRYADKYIDACKFCSGNHCVQFENKVPVAEQTTELLNSDDLFRKSQ